MVHGSRATPAEYSPRSSPTGRLHVAVYSRLSGLDHPYFRHLHQALERRGIAISGSVQIGVSWLRANRGRIDAIHFHWPETIWRDRRSGTRHFVSRAVHSSRELLRTARFLREARRLGIIRVWTIHNLEPHEGASLWDRLGYRLIGRSADIVVSHSAWSLEEAKRGHRIGCGTSIVLPMGTMHEAYPPPRPRETVLTELGLDPARPMVSCLGRLREYKGLDLACAAVERLRGRVQLVVGGPAQSGFDVAALRDALGRVPSAVLLPRHLSDQEFADLMGASDAALLPYRNVTGSAVLLTAIGFGRAVIAADLPYFREVLAGEPDAACLVADGDPAAWAGAIEAFLSRPLELRQRAALRLAERYSWDRAVAPLVEALTVAHG
jgi:beta-1,4-mannosyltransferase